MSKQSVAIKFVSCGLNSVAELSLVGTAGIYMQSVSYGLCTGKAGTVERRVF